MAPVVVDVFRRPDRNAKWQLWSLGSAGRFSMVTGWLVMGGRLKARPAIGGMRFVWVGNALNVVSSVGGEALGIQ